MSEAAYTQEPSAENAYPGYVNFTVLDDGRVKISLRASQLKGPGEKDLARPGELAQLVISGACFVKLLDDANKLELPASVADDIDQLKMEGLDPKPIPEGHHGSDAIIVDENDVRTDEELDDAAQQKYDAQIADMTPDEERPEYGQPFDDQAKHD